MCNIYIIPENLKRSDIDTFFKGRISILLKHGVNYPKYRGGEILVYCT